MLKIGITGGIGSGKSTVCKIFSLYGVPVYESDKRASALMDSDDDLIRAIIELLGTESYGEDGLLDRKFVAGRVFNDPELLSRLNGLVHPAVGLDFERWVAHQGGPYVILESAILIESGFYRLIDKTVALSAPEQLRIRRTMHRDKCTEEDIRSRMRNQLSDAERESKADYIIIADDEHSLIRQVAELHSMFCSLARR